MGATRKRTGRLLDGVDLLRGAGRPAALVPEAIGEMAGQLETVFGPRLAAVVVGVRDAGLISEWARGRGQPPEVTKDLLHAAFQVVELLGQEESPETIRLWFTGRNPALDDRAPAVVFAEDPAAVIAAARAYLAHG